MTTNEGYKFCIGCVSVNIFNEERKLRTGIVDLNVWPFYTIDSRLGCMKEYHGILKSDLKKESMNKQGFSKDNFFAKLFLEFEEFALPMYYSSRDE